MLHSHTATGNYDDVSISHYSGKNKERRDIYCKVTKL